MHRHNNIYKNPVKKHIPVDLITFETMWYFVQEHASVSPEQRHFPIYHIGFQRLIKHSFIDRSF